MAATSVASSSSTTAAASDDQAVGTVVGDLAQPPSIRIDSAPIDVTAADVEEFFRLRQLRCERIDVQRDVEETAGGLVGRVVVVVTFKRHEDCEEALKISNKLKGVDVTLRREVVSAANAVEST